MKIALLATGDELLDGRVLNTNAQWLGEDLFRRGQKLAYAVVMPDDLDAQIAQIRQLSLAYDLVIMSGGLGPTSDDFTREAVARAMGVSLHRDEAAYAHMRQKFEKLGRPMPESNAQQAYFPEGAAIIENPLGSADGFFVRIGSCMLVSLPGVPTEFMSMWTAFMSGNSDVLGVPQRVAGRLIRLYGLGESAIQDRIQDVLSQHPSVHLAFQCYPAEVHLRLGAPMHLKTEVVAFEAALVERLRPFIYGFDDQSFWQRFDALCRKNDWSVAIAESCTGGMIMQELTAIPDVSTYLRGGVVVYQTRTKSDLLGLPTMWIEKKGVVSAPVAGALAEAVAKKFEARVGMSVTGFAGPSGDVEGSPVGTVFVGCHAGGKTVVTPHVFPGDRHQIRVRASYAAVNLAFETMRAYSESDA
jgi:nicotinamide-nucleotide amidase